MKLKSEQIEIVQNLLLCTLFTLNSLEKDAPKLQVYLRKFNFNSLHISWDLS